MARETQSPASRSSDSQGGRRAIRTQVRSKERVRSLAEVYTHEREVNSMLDLVPDMFPSEDEPGNHDRTFLEPACGSGNFLEEILRRKLATVITERYGRTQRYEHRILRCLASVYGIDIDADNVEESRGRLRALIASHVESEPNAVAPSEGLAGAVEAILNTNILAADTLADAQEIQLVAYHPGLGGTFSREWSFLVEPDPQLDLLDPVPSGFVRRDAAPLHYSQLAAHPEPLTEALVKGSRRTR